MNELDLAALRRALPHSVGMGVRLAGDRNLPPLFEQEQALLSPHAVDKRRQQFHLGRAAAHAALAELGAPIGPVGKGPRGEPLWPQGVVGSITHSGGVGLCVVGWERDYRGIGVDLETGVWKLREAARLVCSPAEYAWTTVGSGQPEVAPQIRQAMLFSAKESVFKALYPVEQVWLSFQDAELAWSEQQVGFIARLVRSAGRDFPSGHTLPVGCRVAAGHVLTWTWV